MKTRITRCGKPGGRSTPPINEVIPHPYDTLEKDALQRATEGLYDEAHPGGGGNSSTSQPRGDRPLGVDGEQLGGDPSTDPVCRARVTGAGGGDYPSVDREGDRPRQGLGQQETVGAPAASLPEPQGGRKEDWVWQGVGQYPLKELFTANPWILQQVRVIGGLGIQNKLCAGEELLGEELRSIHHTDIDLRTREGNIWQFYISALHGECIARFQRRHWPNTTYHRDIIHFHATLAFCLVEVT